MTVQHFANCPFCKRPFEFKEDFTRVIIDGFQRIVCDPCAEKMNLTKPVPLRPNGPAKEDRP